jgi:Domain of Unknown Function (DUF1080)
MGDLMPRTPSTGELPRMTRIQRMLRIGSLAAAGAMLLGAAAYRQPNRAGQQGEWRSLFDGKTLNGWRAYKTQDPPRGWTVVDGTIAKERGAQDLVTKDQFGNFELELEWKMGEAGNSGIFYRGTEEYDHIYWSAPEYQLLDNAKASDNKSPLTRAGADYGLYPAPDGHDNPAGEWNKTRIVVRGNHVEHWLNDYKLLEYELGSADWKAKVAASKFGAWPNYGLAKRGYIGIQGDHPGLLSLRNIRIRELH